VRGAIQENAADELELDVAEQLQAEFTRARARRDREQLASYAGREFVFGELEDSGVFLDISGPVETVYAALGRRRQGLKLLARCQQHPELFFQMWTEALKRRRDRAEQITSTRKAKRQQRTDELKRAA
jgi:hypothetical protein